MNGPQWLSLLSRLLTVVAVALEVYGQASTPSIWKRIGGDSVK